MSSESVHVFYNDEAKRIEFPGTGHGERTRRWELRHLEREHSDSPRASDNLSAQNVRNSSYEGNTAFVTFKIRLCAVSKVSR